MTSIAIVGAGTMGGTHAAYMPHVPDVRVAWIVDPDHARAGALATSRRRWPIPSWTWCSWPSRPRSTTR